MQNGILALILSAALVIIIGPFLIPLLKRMKFGQTEREDGPKSHLSKSGTPTMGGIMMIVAIIVATIMCCGGNSTFLAPALLIMAGYGLVGFLDDFIKVKMKRSLGLRAYQKIIAQFGIALVFSWYLYKTLGSEIYLPFFNATFDLSWFYIPFAMFIIIGTVNSVNLTDGLDGLASGVTLIYSIAMYVIFMYIGEAAAQEGQILLSATGNLHVFAAATAGACLGFLRFNSYPARVFMGDTGSMALGGAVAAMALFSRAVLLLPVMGGCFVASSISVILQVGSYKLRNKKRIFKMAPLHHHFELLGYTESKIVSGYMIVTALLCAICLLAYV